MQFYRHAVSLNIVMDWNFSEYNTLNVSQSINANYRYLISFRLGGSLNTQIKQAKTISPVSVRVWHWHAYRIAEMRGEMYIWRMVFLTTYRPEFIKESGTS